LVAVWRFENQQTMLCRSPDWIKWMQIPLKHTHLCRNLEGIWICLRRCKWQLSPNLQIAKVNKSHKALELFGFLVFFCYRSEDN
jgi:hypothetical protein